MLSAAVACSTRRLRRGHLRPRVLDFLAGRDAALEELLVALQVEPGVLDLRLRLLDGGRRLPPLILERTAIDLGDHLSLLAPRRPRRP